MSKHTKLTYSVTVTKGSLRGNGAARGKIFEGDVLIGTFTRRAVITGWIQPIEYKFRTDAAKARFDDFADSLSITETIEALAAGQ